jgi:predicted metal-dependent hydrolase
LAVYPPKGKVRIAAPSDVSDETIRLFTISKLGWIKKQRRKFAEQDRQTNRKYVDRETHYFLGKQYLLRVIEEDKPAKVVIKGKSRLELHVRPNSSIKQRGEVMNRWYRNELKKIAAPIVAKREKRMGL